MKSNLKAKLFAVVAALTIVSTPSFAVIMNPGDVLVIEYEFGTVLPQAGLVVQGQNLSLCPFTGGSNCVTTTFNKIDGLGGSCGGTCGGTFGAEAFVEGFSSSFAVVRVFGGSYDVTGYWFPTEIGSPF